DHAGDVDLDHVSLFFRRPVGGRRGRKRGLTAAVEEAPGDPRDGPRVHAYLAKERVHERALRAEAQGGVHHAIGEAHALAPVAAPAAAAEPVHLEDLDALDALHRLHRLAHDALELVDQADAHGGEARLRREEVLGLVHEPYALGLHLVADTRGDG